jgi:hypothetical protein
MSSIAFRDDGVITSKSKKDAHRAKLAADTEAFMASGGKIKTEEIIAYDASKVLVDEFYLRRLSKLSVAQLKQARCNLDIYGVIPPRVISYVSEGKRKIAMFYKSDVARFLRELKEVKETRGAA